MALHQIEKLPTQLSGLVPRVVLGVSHFDKVPLLWKKLHGPLCLASREHQDWAKESESLNVLVFLRLPSYHWSYICLVCSMLLSSTITEAMQDVSRQTSSWSSAPSVSLPPYDACSQTRLARAACRQPVTISTCAFKVSTLFSFYRNIGSIFSNQFNSPISQQQKQT